VEYDFLIWECLCKCKVIGNPHCEVALLTARSYSMEDPKLLKKALIIFLLGLIICSGCVYKNIVCKQYNTIENWIVESTLTWDSSKYVTKISITYNGKDPLRIVEINPIFHLEYWPYGYKLPNKIVYTWRSDNIEGQIPTPDDLHYVFYGDKFDGQVSVLTREVAERILNNMEIYIKWTDYKGNEFDILAK